jgi:hypothetical protein
MAMVAEVRAGPVDVIDIVTAATITPVVARRRRKRRTLLARRTLIVIRGPTTQP